MATRKTRKTINKADKAEALAAAIDALGNDHPGALTMDGFDDCIVGIVSGYGREAVVCYDREKVLKKLQKSGMTYEEAREYHDFNQAGPL